MENEDAIIQAIFTQLDNLPSGDAKLRLDDIKSKFDTFAKIKGAELKRRGDEVKFSSASQGEKNQSITMDIAQTQLPAEQLGQASPNLIN